MSDRITVTEWAAEQIKKGVSVIILAPGQTGKTIAVLVADDDAPEGETSATHLQSCRRQEDRS